MSKKINVQQRQDLINDYRQALFQGKSLDEALNNWSARSFENRSPTSTSRSSRSSTTNNFWTEKAPFLGSMIVGLILIIIAVGPMLSFFWQNKVTSVVNAGQTMVAPIPNTEILNADNSAQTNLTNNSTAPTMIDDQLDYANLANWFASDTNSSGNLPTLEDPSATIAATADDSAIADTATSQLPYTLSIEKLGITNANVKIGGLNLNENLIQYETTPSPGSLGTTVIFGHSTLRQWYSPAESNPERYKSIFSTIMTLSLGDQIQIKTDQQILTYEVINKKNVKPENIEALLAQDASEKYLRLITCTPEGTTLMRGLVEAVLISEEDV